jgi:multisubunit Na+/H+ antiporter MnhF subunit
MIDSWLFTTVCISILALGALVRILRVPFRLDQLVAGTTVVSLVSMALLALSITWGNLLILDITIVFALCSFAVSIAMAKNTGSCEA